MASNRSAHRVGYAALATLFFISQGGQPTHAQVGSAGAPIIYNAMAQNYQPRGGVLGIEYKASDIFYKRNGEPYTCMIIQGIDAYGPASAAGMSIGDKLCSINGYYFESIQAMAQYIGAGEPGAVVKLMYSRPQTGQRYTGSAKLSDYAQLSVPYRTLSADRLAKLADNDGALGFTFESNAVDVWSDADGAVRHNVHAAKVLDINPESHVNTRQLKSGDMIYAVNNDFVENQEGYLKLMRSFKPGENVHLTFLRQSDGFTYTLNTQIVSRQAALVAAANPQPPSSYTSNSNNNTSSSSGASSVGTAIAVGLGALAAVYVAKKLLSGSSSSEESRRNEYGKNTGSSNTSAPSVYREDTRPAYNSDSAPSKPSYSGGLYGNCHGGSFYGC